MRKTISECRDGKSKSSAQGAATSNSRIPDHSTGKSSFEGSGNPNYRRKPNKNNLKQQQRLFYGSLKGHGSSHNSTGAVSESPPSDAVGFFFGSTPPDSHA